MGDILGHEVHGYRALSFGIDDESFDIVRNCGFKYDSSKLKPKKKAKYGILNLNGYKETFPCIYQEGDFTEFEVSTQKIGNINILFMPESTEGISEGQTTAMSNKND